MKRSKVLRYLICFFVPIIIFNICLLINNIAPLGEYLISIYDSRVQYQGFFYGLQNFDFFSFNLGLGFNFLGTFTYYLVNPIYWIIKFFDINQYNTFYYIIISLKFGLCSLAMQYFLSHEEKTEKLWSIVFSIIYALIGFISTYYYNTFWIDGLIMLPLVLKGINDIVDKKKINFYLITFSIAIILCFYTGYMIGIFSIIYFIYKLIETNKYKDKQIIKKFLIATFLVILISAIVLVPSFFTLINGKSQGYTDSSFTKYLDYNKNIKYVIYSLIPGNYDSSQVAYGYAQNFCTLFIVVQAILFFFNKDIKFKVKIISGIILAYYLLSYTFNLVDYSWQFFQRPVWWQHRYSFTLSFFLMLLAYKNLMHFNKCNPHILIKCFIFVVITLFIVLGYIWLGKEVSNLEKYRIFIVIFSILLLINYIFLFQSKNSKYKYIILILIFCELGLNTFINVKENNNKDTLAFDKITKDSISKTVDAMKQLDNSFYRAELVDSYTSNDGMLFNYNGISYFNSLRNQKVINLAEYYLNFIVDSHCSISLKSFDPYLMSLFNIKYFINGSNLYYYSMVANNLYQNPNALSVAFLVNENIKDTKLSKNEFHSNIEKIYGDMIDEELKLYYYITDAQIELENSAYNEDYDEYDKIDINEEAKAIVSFTASENMFIIPQYRDIKSSANVYINDEQVTLNSSYLYVKKGDKVKFDISFVQSEEDSNIVKFKYLKEEDYNYVMEKLSTYNDFNDIKINEEHLLETKINVKDENYDYLYTSIPYEKGMRIKVNGKKVDPDLIFDTFIGIKLNKRENIITIDYIPRGLILGFIISAIGIILTIIYNINGKKGKKN